MVVRVHRPVDADGALPCLFSIHGGGYVAGSYAMDDSSMDELCPKLGIVGVSVEYRLAPEHPYPAAIDDSATRTRWRAGVSAAVAVAMFPPMRRRRGPPTSRGSRRRTCVSAALMASAMRTSPTPND